jgi:hypothetical protein
MIKDSEEITHRDHFGYLCRRRGLVKEALEVGVDQAVFAKQFMMEWGSDGGYLHLVDPYLPYNEMPGSRTADLMVAINAMMPFHGKFKFHVLESVEAAETLPQWIQPQFIYIDGDHSYLSVRADLDCWWRRLREGGILAGHDYHPDHPGVMRAVKEFAEKCGTTVRLTVEDFLPSWYIYKGEPSTFKKLIK